MKRYKEHKPVKVKGYYFAYKASLDGCGTFEFNCSRETAQIQHYHRFTLELALSDVRCIVSALRRFVQTESKRLDALKAYTGIDND